jgi:hypothetical protein
VTIVVNDTGWMLYTLRGSNPRIDVERIRPIDAPAKYECLRWGDRRKSLPLVTGNAWFERGMAYEIDCRGDLTMRFFPILEVYLNTLT